MKNITSVKPAVYPQKITMKTVTRKLFKAQLLKGPGAERLLTDLTEIRRVSKRYYRQAIRAQIYRNNNPKQDAHTLCALSPASPKLPAQLRLKTPAPQSTNTKLNAYRLQALVDQINPVLKKVAQKKKLYKSEAAQLDKALTEITKLSADIKKPAQPKNASPGVPIHADGQPQANTTDGTGSLTAENNLYDNILASAYNALLTQDPQAANTDGRLTIPQTAFYDFTLYEYLQDPYINNQPESGVVDWFLNDILNIIYQVIRAYAEGTLPGVEYFQPMNMQYVGEVTLVIYNLFLRYVAEDLYRFYIMLEPGYPYSSGSTRIDIYTVFRQWLINSAGRGYIQDSLIGSLDNPLFWEGAWEEIINLFGNTFPLAVLSLDIADQGGSYPFVPFSSYLVNFGLRIVFRQVWKPLGTQKGEIVRTIPLGPKQVEKVSTKAIIRNKMTRNVEVVTSKETETETATTTKDSSEVISEASSSFNLHAEATASASFGAYSASLSVGAGYNSASSSKDTKSQLNESMEKTASKMKDETKIIVSMERETTDEYSTNSEISNPNEEIAITYEYSKLQKQYEIYTYMAEVNSVIFVPEKVPAYDDIDEKWIIQNAAVLSKVLLDDSLRDDLSLLVNEIETEETGNLNDSENKFTKAMTNATDNLGEYKALKGTIPNLFKHSQDAYERQLSMSREIVHKNKLREKRLARMQNHFRKNILHYMRAIWSDEDADQRMQRFAHIMVPVYWDFIEDTPRQGVTPTAYMNGEFVPDTSPNHLKRLSEVINPAGPIGFTGNYAVYYLRSDPSIIDVNKALTVLRTRYVHFSLSLTTALSVTITQRAVIEPRFQYSEYEITYYLGGGWSIHNLTANLFYQYQSPPNIPLLEFEGIRLQFDAFPQVNEKFNVVMRMSAQLQDPEERLLQATVPLPTAAEENYFFNTSLLEDMAYWLPELYDTIAAGIINGWQNLSAQQQQIIRDAYHAYIMKQEHTRRFVVDTNNVFLDLKVGDTPALETYKRLQRLVDVLKELENYFSQNLENRRRESLLNDGNFADPKIQNLSIVAMTKELKDQIAAVISNANGD